MPANNQINPISLSKFNRILKGQTTENDQTNLFIFNKILILLTKLPTCLKETPTSDQLPCISNAEDPIKKQNDYWKNLITKDQLKNIFNYLKIVIDKSNVKINERSDHVNNLLTVCSRFLSTNLFSSEFINIDKDATAKAYLKLLIQITTLPEILKIHDKDYNLKFCELLNSTNQFLQDWAKFNQNNSNSNFDVLKNYVEAIGNLTREFNVENQGSNLAAFETPMTELINVLDPYLTTDQKSDLRYTFVHQYDSGRELINCEKVFNSTDCNSNYASNEFSHIEQGIVLDSSDMSLEHNLDLGNRILKTLILLAQGGKLGEWITKTTNLDNFLDYFKDLIKKANNEGTNLSSEFIENLSKFLFQLTDVFQRTNPQSKFYRSSFSLLLTLLKNPAIEHNLLHIPKAIEAAADQMKILLNDGLKNSTRNPISRIFSTMDVLDDIFHQANDIVTMPAYEKLNIAKKIEEISFICLKLDNCSTFLNQFLKTLGALNRNLVKPNTNEKEVTAIQTIAQKIVTQAQHNVTQAEYEGLAWSYLKGRHDKNVKIIAKRCKEIFNLTHCQEFISAKQTAAPDTTITPTTIIATTNATQVSFTNQTTTDIPASENKQFSLGSKLGTAIGLGALSGFLNGGSQIILHIAEQKNCSLPTQRLLAVTLALANSLAISTLPLIYSIVENLANDETDSLVNSEKLFTCTYAFITSIILQSINAGVQFTFPKKTLLKNLLTMLPLFTGLWMLANSDENILEYISVLAANIITALATSSSLTYFGLKRFPVNRSNDLVEKANENKDVELKPFNTENDVKPTADVIVESKDIGNIKKTYLYITSEKFDEIKENSQKVVKLFEMLVSELKENIEKNRAQIDHDTIPDIANMYQKIIDNTTKVLKIITTEFNLKSEIGLLYDDHEKACQKYIIGSKHTETEEAEIKNAYTSAMEKLGNVFKRLNPEFGKLELQLIEAKGYAEAARACFANNDKTLDNLNDLLKAIGTPFQEIKLYLSIYNTWDAGVQGKKEGVKEGAKRALENKENFEKSIQSATSQITSRPRKTRSFLSTRPQSVASDSRTHSSGSEEGSVISTGSSKDEENALILRPLLKSSR